MPGPETARGYAWRVGAGYFALFLVIGVQLPYLPAWLAWKGLDGAQIGLVLAVPMVLRLVVSPLLGVAADARGAHRAAVVVLSGAATLAAALMLVAEGFAAVLALVTLLILALSCALPLTETIAMAGVRAHGLDYGRVRVWGSLSFIAASLGAGAVIAQSDAGRAIPLLVGAGVLAFAAALLLPQMSAERSGTETRPALTRDALALFTRPAFTWLVIAAGAIQATHAVFYALGTVHWLRLGHSADWIGVLWTIGVLAEIVLFAFGGQRLAAASPVVLLLIGAGAAVVRWTAMPFDPPLAALIGLQTLHAATYAATHLGAMHLIRTSVPAEQAGAAQALYATATGGVALAAATYAAGFLYDGLGAASYLAMAGLGGIGVLAALRLARHVSAERLSDASPPQAGGRRSEAASLEP